MILLAICSAVAAPHLKEHIEREKLPPIITYDCAMDVLAELSKDTDDLAAESIRVLSAFDLPRMRYNGAQKQFFVAHDYLCSGMAPPLPPGTPPWLPFDPQDSPGGPLFDSLEVY